jgi:hypothetical protein
MESFVPERLCPRADQQQEILQRFIGEQIAELDRFRPEVDCK